MTEQLGLTYVEIDVPYCSLTYGVTPCQASLDTSPPTGTRKCFNSLGTCQDRASFDNVPVTLRFALATDYLPSDIDCLPYIKDVDFTSSIVSLGGDLGQRATLRVIFVDAPHSDTGEGFDKYLSERDYDPYEQGKFWGKFRARHPFLVNRPMRVIRGLVGQDLADMETRHFLIESFDGPKADGTFEIIAKDFLKLADGSRAQAPALSNGFLAGDIDDNDTSIVLSETGVGNTDYPASGYVVLGGNEIVYFERDPYTGLNASTQLLLHVDGADAGTTITDSSGNGRNGTAVGNAQLDTANKKYGTAALLLDGTGDYVTVVDNAAWTFAGDFSIDCWAYFDDLAAARTLFSHSSGTTANQYRMVVSTTGVVTFEVVSASVTIITLSSAAAAVIAEAWTHFAIVRTSTTYKIYVNGVQVATVTDADAIPNFTSTFKIGAAGDAASDLMKGAIDEFRVQSDDSFTADFSALLPGPYNNTTPDTLTITRAQFNTEAASHSTGDRVQLGRYYLSETPATIIADLFENDADAPSAYIPNEDWEEECALFLQRLFTGFIAEPMAVNKIISELVEQAALAMWSDDENEEVRLQVLRGIQTDAVRFTEDNILQGTLTVKEQPEKRVSEVWVYFGKVNPTKGAEDPDNYRSVARVFDPDLPDGYDVPAIKKIYSRWIPAGGRSTAERVANIILGRFKTPPRRFTFEVMRYGQETVTLGLGGNIAFFTLVDDTGAMEDVPIQITRLDPAGDRFKIEAEEMRFDVADDFDDRDIIIENNTTNVDLRDLYDLLFPEPVAGDIVNCYIRSGVVVGSTAAVNPALDVGDWPAGVAITIDITGRIQGLGGAGGRGGNGVFGNGVAGSPGGTALYTRTPVTITGTGKVLGGGGGGGGGGASDVAGGGGGGGAQGAIPGAGGGGGSASSLNGGAGTAGTNDTAGPGGPGASIFGTFGGDGGPGGTAGVAGTAGNIGDGGFAVGGAGGAAGNAIDGDSDVTELGTLTVTGARIN